MLFFFFFWCWCWHRILHLDALYKQKFAKTPSTIININAINNKLRGKTHYSCQNPSNIWFFFIERYPQISTEGISYIKDANVTFLNFSFFFSWPRQPYFSRFYSHFFSLLLRKNISLFTAKENNNIDFVRIFFLSIYALHFEV